MLASFTEDLKIKENFAENLQNTQHCQQKLMLKYPLYEFLWTTFGCLFRLSCLQPLCLHKLNVWLETILGKCFVKASLIYLHKTNTSRTTKLLRFVPVF